MNSRLIIALSGKAGTGKSTLANHLTKFFRDKGLQAFRASFAETLRKECDMAFPEIDWWQKPTPPLVRQMLRTWGQIRRETYPDYWVNSLVSKLMDDCVYIIDDLRFQNEARYLLLEENAKLFRLELQNNPLVVSPDISETDLDNFDYWSDIFTPEYGALDKLVPKIWQNVRGHEWIINSLGNGGERT